MSDLVEVWFTGEYGKEMAHGQGGQGHDRGLLFKLVQTDKTMARAELQGHFAAVSEGL
jgi:hypothetical protein